MFITETISLFENTSYKSEITVSYKDESKLEWLIKELNIILILCQSMFFSQHITAINTILSDISIDVLVVDKIKSNNQIMFFKNNVIISSHFLNDPNITNYFYETLKEGNINRNCYIHISKTSYNYLNEPNFTGNEKYIMSFKYNNKCNTSNIIAEKHMMFKDGILTEIYYNFCVNNIKIHIKFEEFIKINDKIIPMKNNRYDVDCTATKSTFFDFEFNENIKELLLKDLWLIRYSLSFSVLKELFKSR